MGQGRHTLRSVSDPVYPPGPCVQTLGFVSIEDNVQIISIVITNCQHCSHDCGSRSEQHNVVSIGEGPKKYGQYSTKILSLT